MKKNLLTLIALLVFAAGSSAQVVITEIMYNPPESGTDSLEFLELYNNSSQTVDMTGWEMSDGVSLTFPNVSLGAGQYLLICEDSLAMQNVFGVAAWEWSSGALSNGGERLELTDSSGNIIDSLTYDDTAPWDTLADSYGYSLVLCDPNTDNNLASNWTVASTQVVGQVINGVQLYAHPAAGCPTGDSIPPAAIRAVATSATSVTVIFNEAVNQTAESTANYTGLGSVSNAVRTTSNDSVVLTLMTALTPGMYESLVVSNVQDAAGNTQAQPDTLSVIFNNTTPALVITEIMYNPPESGTDSLEYIEIYNNSGSPAALGGFSFTEGVNFTFPELTLPTGGFVVVCEDSMVMQNFFGIAAWEWSGALSNGGEDIEIVNTDGTILDSLTYDDAMPWDTLADGFGYSLALCDPNDDNGDPANWTVESKLNFAGLVGTDSVYATPGRLNCAGLSAQAPVAPAVQLFPNPAQSQVTVTGLPAQSGIELMDVTGRVFESRTASKGKVELKTNGLARGLYFVRVINASGEILKVKKLILN